MAGFGDKENVSFYGKEKWRSKEGRTVRTPRRRGPDYLNLICKRYLRNEGIGDGSPPEFFLRGNSQGDKRKSFEVYEDDADSLRFRYKQPEIASKGRVQTVARLKNATAAKCRCVTGEQSESLASGQQVWDNYIPHSVTASRTCNEALIPAKLRPKADIATQQESISSTFLGNLAARCQRGERGNISSQCPLDDHELEQACRKIDQEDLDDEMEIMDSDMAKEREQVLEKDIGGPAPKEIEKCLLVEVMHEQNEIEKQMQEDDMLEEDLPEEQDLSATVHESEPQASVMVYGEELVNIVELSPEPFNNQEWIITKPAIDDDANQSLDTLLHTSDALEEQLARTVDSVEAWSVELDSGRRRRESKQFRNNWHTPLPRRLIQFSRSPFPETSDPKALRTPTNSVNQFDRLTQLTGSSPLSTLRSRGTFGNALANRLVASFDEGSSPTASPTAHEIKLQGKKQTTERVLSRFESYPGHTSPDMLETHSPLTADGEKIRTWKDSEETLRSSCLTSQAQTPKYPLHSLRQFSVQAISFPVQASADTSPTEISGEELNRSWLQFCDSPSVVPDTKTGNTKSRAVDTSVTEHALLRTSTSEELLQTTTGADVSLNVGKEAVSGFLQRKTSMNEIDELPRVEEEASGDILQRKTPLDESDEPSKDGERTMSNDGHVQKKSFYAEGAMDYENDDISNDTTYIVQTGAPSVLDQEGTSALKENPQEDALSHDVHCVHLTSKGVYDFEETVGEDEYSLAHLEEERIDSLQVTPGMGEACAERMTDNGESVQVNHIDQLNAVEAGNQSPTEELFTLSKDKDRQPPQTQDECTETRTKRSRKTIKLNIVDSPLDAGSKWSNGQRRSTRIKSKPLDWWRGERMLYGRVHSTLTTLIGIKHLSPDPVWPSPSAKRNSIAPPKFKVDSFVSDEHSELLRLAAQ